MSERWLPVVGFEEFYEVSDLGRVRSLDRIVAGGCRPFRKPGRVLRLNTTKSGYKFACLSVSGARVYKYIHRLVCESFIGPAPFNNAEADHDNKIRDDIRLDNLKWTTLRNNRLLRDISKGESHVHALLKETDILEIRVSSEPKGTLALRYGISLGHVWKIRNGKAWRHVNDGA